QNRQLWVFGELRILVRQSTAVEHRAAIRRDDFCVSAGGTTTWINGLAALVARFTTMVRLHRRRFLPQSANPGTSARQLFQRVFYSFHQRRILGRHVRLK